jgi:hypothetical protein
MGRGQSPSADELKLIYGLLDEGYSDTDILAKYDDLNKHGKLGSLPYRTDKRFIRQRRKEFEAARAILESSIKMHTDPLVVKAREAHLSEIRDVMQEWFNALDKPILPFYNEKSKFGVYDVEANVLFNCLKEHLPSPGLWLTYSQLLDNVAEYWSHWGKMWVKCKEEAQNWSGVLEIHSDFAVPMMLNVRKREQGVKPDIYEFIIRDDRKTRPHRPFVILCRLSSSNEWMTIIIANDNAESCKESYKEMSTGVLSSKEITRLISLRNKITELQNEILNLLQEALAQRAYVTRTCRLCPGQKLPSF